MKVFRVTYEGLAIRIEAANEIEAKKKGLFYFYDLEHGRQSIPPWKIIIEEINEKGSV